MMRAFTMYVTVMPVASKTYYCSPKSNHTNAAVITLRAIRILVGKWCNSYWTFKLTEESTCALLSFRNGFIDQWPTRLLWRLYLQRTYGNPNDVVSSNSRVHTEEMASVTLALVASHFLRRRLCYGRSWTLYSWCPYCLLCYHSNLLDVSYYVQ